MRLPREAEIAVSLQCGAAVEAQEVVVPGGHRPDAHPELPAPGSKQDAGEARDAGDGVGDAPLAAGRLVVVITEKAEREVEVDRSVVLLDQVADPPPAGERIPPHRGAQQDVALLLRIARGADVGHEDGAVREPTLGDLGARALERDGLSGLPVRDDEGERPRPRPLLDDRDRLPQVGSRGA